MMLLFVFLQLILNVLGSRMHIFGLLLIRSQLSHEMLQWTSNGENLGSIRKRKIHHPSLGWNIYEDEMEENLVSILDLPYLVQFVLFCSYCIFLSTLWRTHSILRAIHKWISDGNWIQIWLCGWKNWMVVMILIKIAIKFYK